MKSDITPEQTSDYRGFDLVMDDNLPAPAVLIADRGYDSEKVRKTMEARNVVPVIQCASPAGCASSWIGPSTACAISSSGASTSSRMPAALPPAMTRPPKAISASSISHRSACGAAICQHDLIQRVFIKPPVVNLVLEVEVLLCLEGAAIAHQQQEFIRLHSHDLLSGHEFLTLL